MRSGQIYFDRSDEMSKMRAAAEKAVQLDPLSAEAHDALGIVYSRDAQWAQSEKSFRHALELDPNRSLSHTHFSKFFLLPLDRIDDAVREARIAEKGDPLSPDTHLNLAYALISARRFDEAAEQCRKLPSNDARTNQWMGRVRLNQGRIDEAIQLFSASADPLDPGANLGHAYGRAGRREEAEKLAAATSNPFTRHDLCRPGRQGGGGQPARCGAGA